MGRCAGWLKAGEAGREPYAIFRRRYKAARARAERSRTLFAAKQHGIILTVKKTRPYTTRTPLPAGRARYARALTSFAPALNMTMHATFA